MRYLVPEEGGQGLMEYALLIGLIAILVIAILTVTGDRIYQFYADFTAMDVWNIP